MNYSLYKPIDLYFMGGTMVFRFKMSTFSGRNKHGYF